MTCWHPESRDSFWGREAEETEGRAYKSETVGKKQERRGRGDGGLAAGRRQKAEPGEQARLVYRQCSRASHLYEGSQDFPGFLVELLSIPVRVEFL